MKKKINTIMVLQGGNSSEREISLRSGSNILNALQSLGYKAIAIDPSTQDIPNGIDFAFIALHGSGGEDGAIQGLLEWKGIPYSGPGIAASAIAFDKVLTKTLLQHHKLPTASFFIINNETDLNQINTFPVVIKPALEGSSIGVAIVDNKEELHSKYNELKHNYNHLFCETYLKGREITVSILNEYVFPILELIPKNRFYDFEAKYTKGMTEFVLPAKFDQATQTTIQTIAQQAYNAIGCKGAVRIDMIVTEDKDPWILEINTIPGMTDTSDLPAQAKAAGMDFPQLVQAIIEAS